MNFQVFNREQYLFFPWLQSFANTSQAGSPASRMTLTHNTTLPEIYLFCYLWWPWKVEILSGSYLLKFTDKRSRCARHDVEPRFRIPFFFAFFRNSLSPRYHGVASVEKRGWVHGISIFFVKYNHEIRRGEHLLKRQRDAFFKKKKKKKRKLIPSFACWKRHFFPSFLNFPLVIHPVNSERRKTCNGHIEMCISSHD